MSILTNANVLITGGTGTFGHAFVRRALHAGARRVVVFSRDELKQSQMASQMADDRLRFMIGDVRDHDRLVRALRGVDYVIHAAAMKQVPACELHPWEAEEVNSIGSRNVAMAAIECGVRRAVLLSSDKAANPNTLYGATKLAAERHFTAANVYAAGTPTRLLATRYGNVLGSRGSVIEVWRAQQARGVPLTITDRACTRFWMGIGDAVWLVETSLTHGRGGEVFVPKIGAAPLMRLVEAVAGPHATVVETGMRRSEKLHELLITEDEARTTLYCGDWYVIEPDRTWEHLPPMANGRPVATDFVYASNRNSWQHTADDLRDLLGSWASPADAEESR